MAGFDFGALALACGFAALAQRTRYRARNGPPHSVWALPARGPAAGKVPASVADPS